MRDGRWIGNVVTNVCLKFHYDRLRTDKALGNCRKSDNNKNNHKENKTTFVALGDPFQVKNETWPGKLSLAKYVIIHSKILRSRRQRSTSQYMYDVLYAINKLAAQRNAYC